MEENPNATQPGPPPALLVQDKQAQLALPFRGGHRCAPQQPPQTSLMVWSNWGAQERAGHSGRPTMPDGQG